MLESFADRYHEAWCAGMRAKLGLPEGHRDNGALVDDLLALLRVQRVDYTSCFRALSSLVRGDAEPARALFREPLEFEAWSARWLERVSAGEPDMAAVAAAMDRVNPVYIPRNHLVEEALTAATAGDMAPFDALVAAVAEPFASRLGLERYAEPAPPSFDSTYQTFCGT